MSNELMQFAEELEQISKFGKYEQHFDNVKHPNHYQGVHGMEVIDVMKNFLPKYKDGYTASMIKDVIKYTLRAPSKGKLLEDLQKAREYLDYAIESVEGRE